MAALSQTPANVAIGSATTPTRRVQYGEAITQGQPLYQDTTNQKYYRCDANDGVVKARCSAIALTPGAADAYGIVALPGTEAGASLVNLGATLTVGEVYCVGATVGQIVPVADLTTGDYVTIVGVAGTAALLDFQVIISNVQEP